LSEFTSPTRLRGESNLGLTPLFTAVPCSYILNRGWIDRSADYVPSYNEITTKPKKAKKPAEDNSDLSADEGVAVDDEGFDDKADEFETKYNFRFEEPYVQVL
jgi:protein KRI1